MTEKYNFYNDARVSKSAKFAGICFLILSLIPITIFVTLPIIWLTKNESTQQFWVYIRTRCIIIAILAALAGIVAADEESNESSPDNTEAENSLLPNCEGDRQRTLVQYAFNSATGKEVQLIAYMHNYSGNAKFNSGEYSPSAGSMHRYKSGNEFDAKYANLLKNEDLTKQRICQVTFQLKGAASGFEIHYFKMFWDKIDNSQLAFELIE